MTRTTVSQRVSNRDFLRRILDALDWTPEQAAEKLGVPLAEVLPLYKGRRGQLAAIDRDPVWAKLVDHIDNRIGVLLGVRTELQRKLDADRREREAMRARTLNR